MNSSALAQMQTLASIFRAHARPRYRRQMSADDAEASIASWLGVSVPEVRRVLLMTWDSQRGVLSAAEVADAMEAGDLTGSTLERWRRGYASFVVNHLGPVWRRGNARAGAFVSNSLSFGLPAQAFADRMATWIDDHGGELVTYLADVQHDAVKIVLQRAAAEGLASNTVAQQLKPIIGLTRRQAATLEAYRAALVADPDVLPSTVNRLVSRRATTLHNARATNIARTELADAYNEASIQTVRVALEEEALDEAPEKVWLTSEDERTCPICGPLHDTRAKLNGAFGPFDRPTAHPGCRCTLVFEFKDQE